MICRPDRAIRAALLLGLCAITIQACADEPDRRPALEVARSALAAGEPLAAEAALRRALAAGAPDSAVAALMGEAALVRGDLPAAHRWLDPADFDTASAPLGWQIKGRLALAEGDVPLAQAAFERALALGESASVWVDIARLRYRMGNHFPALEALERARAQDPDNSDVAVLTGQVLRDEKGPGGVLAFYRKARAGAGPTDPRIMRDHAAALGDAGQAAAALNALGDDDSAQANFLRAVIAARGGNVPLARRLLQRVDAAGRRAPAARLLEAVLDLESGNAASAAAALDRLAAEQPDNIQVRDLHVAATARALPASAVIARFAGAANGPHGSPYLRTMVARAYEAMDERLAAAQLLDRAANPPSGLVALAPRQAESGIAAGIAAARASGLPAAVTLVSRYPGSADALAVMGDALARAGAAAPARRAYARAAQIRASWPLLLRRMAVAETRSEARTLLTQWLAGNPASAEGAALLADAAAAQGDWRRAALLLDHAIANGMARVPWVNAARSVAAARLGDEEGALAWALEARALQPMNRAAVAALLAALPRDQAAVREEMRDTLNRLPRG